MALWTVRKGWQQVAGLSCDSFWAQGSSSGEWNSLNTPLSITAQTRVPTWSTGELCPALTPAAPAASGGEEAAAEPISRFQTAISLR